MTIMNGNMVVFIMKMIVGMAVMLIIVKKMKVMILMMMLII